MVKLLTPDERVIRMILAGAVRVIVFPLVLVLNNLNWVAGKTEKLMQINNRVNRILVA